LLIPVFKMIGSSVSTFGKIMVDDKNKEISMASMDEQILRAAKEIVVKFIEAGRVSPAGFSETFKSVYQTVDETARGVRPEDSEENS